MRRSRPRSREIAPVPPSTSRCRTRGRAPDRSARRRRSSGCARANADGGTADRGRRPTRRPAPANGFVTDSDCGGVTQVLLPGAKARVRSAGRVALRPTRRGTTERSTARADRRPRWPCTARRRPPRARRATRGTGRCAACTQRASMPRSAPSARSSRRCLDPTLGRDQEVALRRGRKLGRRPVAVGRRTLLGRGRRHMPSSRDDVEDDVARDRRAPNRNVRHLCPQSRHRGDGRRRCRSRPAHGERRQDVRPGALRRGWSTRATATRPGE